MALTETTKRGLEPRIREIAGVLLLVAFALTPLSAHVMVSPAQSKRGATQRYELRVHNEALIAATSIDIEIPNGLTITQVAMPAFGTYTTRTKDGRITAITWRIAVSPGTYVALPFTANNPLGPAQLRWSVRERMADGSVVDWSDKPGAHGKGLITTLTSTGQ
jgi:uncharacterized protein YcnI